MSSQKKIYIVGAYRTAVGSLNKSLKGESADSLGAEVIKNLINTSTINLDEIDEVVLGQVLTGGSGQNPARQAAIKSGIPKAKPAYLVNQVCGSGLRSIASGYQSIKDDVNNAGAKYIDAAVVEDGGIITSPHYKYLGDWMKLIISKFND